MKTQVTKHNFFLTMILFLLVFTISSIMVVNAEGEETGISMEENGLPVTILDEPIPLAELPFRNVVLLLTEGENYNVDLSENGKLSARAWMKQNGITFEKNFAESVDPASASGTVFTGLLNGEIGEYKKTIGQMMLAAGYYTAYKGVFPKSTPELASLDGFGFFDWTPITDATTANNQEIASDTIAWLKDTGAVKNENGQSFFLVVNFASLLDNVPSDPEEFNKAYLQSLQENDKLVYDILLTMNDLGLLHDTIILMTSTTTANALNALQTKTVNVNTIRTPMMIYHPSFGGGQTVQNITSQRDLAVTLLDLTNVEDFLKTMIFGDLPGKSLIPYLAGEGSLIDESGKVVTISESGVPLAEDPFGDSIPFSDPTLSMDGVITNQYMFTRNNSTNERFLYDLNEDPDGVKNLAADPAYADVVSTLEKQLTGE
ncbi:sulfatase-like hydrolase/transferase [Flexilinea flocculi]|uniref:Sulfatase n=1 Tax=Flexilinea flocculi TaxID=1678840 RepID=A0A0S7BIM1_9CHLR|nr:sulfatase-like hydrolase/transferase [Flexilinea flocculi]GAP40213.1 sulfatase [Flexilinea flocculi]